MNECVKFEWILSGRHANYSRRSTQWPQAIFQLSLHWFDDLKSDLNPSSRWWHIFLRALNFCIFHLIKIYKKDDKILSRKLYRKSFMRCMMQSKKVADLFLWKNNDEKLWRYKSTSSQFAFERNISSNI